MGVPATKRELVSWEELLEQFKLLGVHTLVEFNNSMVSGVAADGNLWHLTRVQ
jgi:hypothetical protein